MNNAPLALPARKKKKRWSLFFLILPFMIYYVIFDYVPLFGWVIAFMDYHIGRPMFSNEFVGLKNFILVLQSRELLRVLKNTAIFSVLSFILLWAPIIFALLLTEIDSPRFRRVTQTITTIPHFISWIIGYSLVFAILSNDGLLNQILAVFGARQSVLTDAQAVYWFQSLLGVWKGVGWDAIIYIAAITGIDQELYEAATVDGAGRMRCVWHITIPGIMPTFLVLALFNIAGFLNGGMGSNFVFRNSLVMDTIETLDLYIYRMGLQLFDYSYATAAGIMKSMISITLMFVVNNLSKKVRGETIL